MIDVLLVSLLFIVFLICILTVAYLIYDYNKYKTNVNSSFESSTKHINSSYDKISKNILSTKTELLSDINAVKKDTKSLDIKFDTSSVLLNDVKNKLDKHFEFSVPKKELNMLSSVKTSNGMRLNTSKNMVDNTNLRICDDKDSCIQFNANNGTFNITPDNTKNLVINNKSKKPIAKFDMDDNSIYLGGSDMNAPFFIHKDKVYVKNINMIVKESDDVKITKENIRNFITASLDGDIMLQLLKYGMELQNYQNIIDKNLYLFFEKNKTMIEDSIKNGVELVKLTMSNNKALLNKYEPFIKSLKELINNIKKDISEMNTKIA